MIEWATHHKADPPPPEDDEFKEKKLDEIDPWDQGFLKVDQGTLFELILVRPVACTYAECNSACTVRACTCAHSCVRVCMRVALCE